MDDELFYLSRRLREEGEKTLGFFSTLPRDLWEIQVYTEGTRWRIRQVLAHFVSTERIYQHYLADVLEGGKGAPLDMDIDQFNEAEVARLGSQAVDDLLVSFREAREETLRLTGAMEEGDLLKTAVHPWFGERTLGWYLKLIYRHNNLHLQDIRRAIETGGPVPHTDAHRVGRNVNPPR